MTTYQDIVDYLNKNYPGKFSLFKDFDITIDAVPSSYGYILSIKAK